MNLNWELASRSWMAMANMTMPTTFLAKGTKVIFLNRSSFFTNFFCIWFCIMWAKFTIEMCKYICIYEVPTPKQRALLCLVGIAKFVAVSYIKVAMVYFLAQLIGAQIDRSSGSLLRPAWINCILVMLIIQCLSWVPIRYATQ
jgi:hypothetical protein